MSISNFLNESIQETKYTQEIGEMLHESSEMIFEKLITLGGKAYPKFGNVVIMAGGAGSGKGFISSNLLGIEGKVFDVDALKSLSLRAKKIGELAKEKFGVDLGAMDLRNPDNVGTLHDIIGNELNLPKKQQSAMFASILTAPSDRKPNLIFDVTMKDIKKLQDISRNIRRLGYECENIHIVWVINDIDVAIAQNQSRSRVVAQDILMQTHRGVALTMSDIVKGAVEVKQHMDGDIWFVFNKKGVDSTLQMSKTTKGAFAIKDAEMIKIKQKGKPLDKKKLSNEVIDKIISYVPKIDKLFK